MTEIQLTKGKTSIVDDCDSDLSAYKWHLWSNPRQPTMYAIRIDRLNGKSSTVALHSIIASRMGIIGSPDHKDGNGLNNSRGNLRQANRSQNGANRRGWSASGFKGVVWYAKAGKWKAQITVNKKVIYLGCFDLQEDAARAYDRAAIDHFGEYALTNLSLGRLAT